MQDNKNNNSIDKILQELDSQDMSYDKKNSIDEDVDAILESLAINKNKTQNISAVEDVQIKNTQKAHVPESKLQDIETPLHNNVPNNVEIIKQMKMKTGHENSNTLNEINDIVNNAPKAKIITAAPLNAPVIQSETETLELPTIKAYSELQAKRLAEIERIAVEKAIERSQKGKKNNPYALPGMKLRKEALRVDVDDHFRDFFMNSVANVSGGMPAPINATENIDNNSKKVKRKKTTKGKAPNGVVVVASSDNKKSTDAALQINEEPVGTHGTLAGFTVLSQSTDAFGIPVDNTKQRNQGSQSMQDAHNVQNKGNVQQINQNEQVNNVPAGQPTNFNNNGAEYYTDSIVKQNDISDTFMQNHIDVDDVAGEPQNEINIGVKNKSEISEMLENLKPAQGDFWQESKSSGAIFKEITVNMPITRTSTMGIDPDKYGLPADDYEENHDYNKISDAPAVLRELKSIKLSKLASAVVSAIVFLVLILLDGIVKGGNDSSLAAIISPSTYLIINTALLLFVGAVCVQTLKSGFLGIFARPSTDTLSMFAFLGAIMQAIVYFIYPSSFVPQSVTLFSPIAVLLFFILNAGKYLHAISVIKNFKITSDGENQSAGFIVNGRDLTKMVCSGLSEPSPVLLLSRPTSLVKGFMKHSFSSYRSDVFARKISLILFLSAITCAIISLVFTSDVSKTVSAFAAVLCIGAPLTATLVYAVPSIMLQTATTKVGAVVPGAAAIQSLGYCNTVLLRSEELFLTSDVKLHGIKPFAGRRIDIAILFAASIIYYNCNTLRDTFMALIDNKKSVLLPVTNSETVAGFGFTATVDGQYVVFGNRAMMRRYNIELPSLEYENNFTKNGKYSVMYLALNHRPYSMYIVGYNANASTKRSLDGLIQSGFSVVIQSDDFNITSQKAANIYNLPSGSVKVLSQTEQDMLVGQTEYMPESEGYMVHSGTSKSFIGAIKAATQAARREKACNTVQIAAVLLSVVILLLMSVLGVIGSLSLTIIILYQLAWSAVTLLPCFINNS